ncbi:transmembrane protein, putative, partial [Bodo saltans]
STALHHTCSSDPTGQMMRVLASSENLTVYDTTATVVLGAPACLQQQGQSIWPSLGAALSSLSAADSIALSNFTTTAVATEAFLCVAQHNVCMFPLLFDSGVGASPMWLVSYHHQQQSGSNAPDVPFSSSSSIVWPIIVAWAAALICCSVVLLATRRLYVLPTLALRSVLVAAFQATPAASP